MGAFSLHHLDDFDPQFIAGYNKMAVNHLKPQLNANQGLRWKVQSLAIETIQLPMRVGFVMFIGNNNGKNNINKFEIILQTLFKNNIVN